MSAVAALVADLRGRGVELTPAAGRIRFDAPKGALAPADRAAIAERKAELLAYLAADPWERLLRGAREVDPELAQLLGLFRDAGCALEVVDGRVFFGPFDDFADCDWADAGDWWRDYGVRLKPYEAQLRRLLESLADSPVGPA
jgi:hypothetical protein